MQVPRLEWKLNCNLRGYGYKKNKISFDMGVNNYISLNKEINNS